MGLQVSVEIYIYKGLIVTYIAISYGTSILIFINKMCLCVIWKTKVGMCLCFVFDTWRSVLEQSRDIISDTIFGVGFGGSWKNRISSETSKVWMGYWRIFKHVVKISGDFISRISIIEFECHEVLKYLVA